MGSQAMGQVGTNYASLNSASSLGRAKQAVEGNWIKDRIKSIRDELGGLGKDRATRIAEMRHHIHVVDPDIAAMRSLSDIAKQRIQAERNFDRDMARHKSWLGKELENLLKESPLA
jgi:hypothetical protein